MLRKLRCQIRSVFNFVFYVLKHMNVQLFILHEFALCDRLYLSIHSILYLYTYVFEQCAYELPRNEKGPSLFQNMLKHTRFSPSKLMTIYSRVEAQNPNQSYGSCKMYLNVVRSFIHQRETQPVSSWTSAPSPEFIKSSSETRSLIKYHTSHHFLVCLFFYSVLIFYK